MNMIIAQCSQMLMENYLDSYGQLIIIIRYSYIQSSDRLRKVVSFDDVRCKKYAKICTLKAIFRTVFENDPNLPSDRFQLAIKEMIILSNSIKTEKS